MMGLRNVGTMEKKEVLSHTAHIAAATGGCVRLQKDAMSDTPGYCVRGLHVLKDEKCLDRRVGLIESKRTSTRRKAQ
jgi:hypothetical protein